MERASGARIGRVSCVAAAAGLAELAVGQCQQVWSAYPGPPLDHAALCATTWDPDGQGPAQPLVVLGGNFESAGRTALGFVAAYDGSALLPMATGVSGTVEAVTVFGGEPVIGGGFSQGGGNTLNKIARFHNQAWLPLGSGVGPVTFSPYVECLTTHSGSLIVGGQFLNAGGTPVQGLARWDGTTWHAFPDERAAGPHTLAAFNGVLYAGGWFLVPGSAVERTGVLRWDEPTWASPGSNPPNDETFALTYFRGKLIAGGFFTNAAGQHISAYDGAGWTPLGLGINGVVRALIVFDPDGTGPMPDLLIAGGSFSFAGGQPASSIAAWDGATWMPLGAGASSTVRALTVWNNQLVVIGDFGFAGTLSSPGLAFWGCPQPPPCYPNCDSSTTPPMLNVSDFTCFINAFGSASPYANCDGSTTTPALNIHDFICFLNRFAAGCP